MAIRAEIIGWILGASMDRRMAGLLTGQCVFDLVSDLLVELKLSE